MSGGRGPSSQSRRERVVDSVTQLSELCGPSGAEHEVCDWLRARWEPVCSEVRVDRIGNLYARLGGNGPAAALVAHMDELGWVVSRIRDDGVLLANMAESRRRSADSALAQAPIGQPARILTRNGGWLPGTFAMATGHARPSQPGEAGRWWIDAAFASGDDARAAGVHVGAPVVPGTRVRRIEERLVGKAMDDRALLAIADVIATTCDPGQLARDTWLIATVQEENGTIGADAAARAIELEQALVLDVAPAGDIPDQPEDLFPLALGGGPVLVHRDSGVAYGRAFGAVLARAAAHAGRTLVDGAYVSYGSDGREYARAGIETALLTLPTRYTHSTYETVDLGDIEALTDVVIAWLEGHGDGKSVVA